MDNHRVCRSLRDGQPPSLQIPQAWTTTEFADPSGMDNHRDCRSLMRWFKVMDNHRNCRSLKLMDNHRSRSSLKKIDNHRDCRSLKEMDNYRSRKSLKEMDSHRDCCRSLKEMDKQVEDLSKRLATTEIADPSWDGIVQSDGQPEK
uniref:Uncharacterized protein n=1 Tax=Xenopus tropicalis TaxID=8364 RepID=A0A1B8Y1H1_XENTR